MRSSSIGFRNGCLPAAHSGSDGEHYYQVVISASHDLAGRERQSVWTKCWAICEPSSRRRKRRTLLRWQLITDQQAVFSVRPGLDAIRPPQQTAMPNLLLAGDWTRTGWPATMEGAVRSGYLAAEAILRSSVAPERILVADLPRNWFARAALELWILVRH